MLLTYKDDFPALIDSATGRVVTHVQLFDKVAESAQKLFPKRGLLFLFANNTVESIIVYLAALRADVPVALLDKQLKKHFAHNLIDNYKPEYIYSEANLDLPEEYRQENPNFYKLKTDKSINDLHKEVAVLLSTSGSTGSPKFVRLSAENILSNTAAISESLHIDRNERAITILQFHYSYGMSVLNTHLKQGASIVVTNSSVMEAEFWESMQKYEVTSLAGVPYTYQMLDRLGFRDRELPHLRNLTQAGGKMPLNLTKKIWQDSQDKQRNLYVMYGQTEASPRISCVPADYLEHKMGSAGRVLSKGKIWVRNDEGHLVDTAEVVGEIVYEGPNVMMGYAEERNDLSLGDVQGGILHTGDLGYLDKDGFLFITGRSKRIAKVFGLRISLDEVEGMLLELGAVAAVGAADKLHVYHESTDKNLVSTLRKKMATDLKIPLQAIRLNYLERLPTMASGKVNYRELVSMSERE